MTVHRLGRKLWKDPWWWLWGTAAVLLVFLVACGDDDVTSDLSDNDLTLVPVDRADLNPVTYGNYDGWPNIVAWCDGTARIYTSSRVGADGFQVVPDHPLCSTGDEPGGNG